MEKRYRVVADYQGGEFGFYRDLTVEQWRVQATEWANVDDNDELYDITKNLKDSEVIDFIAENWDLEFVEVSKYFVIECEPKQLRNIAEEFEKLGVDIDLIKLHNENASYSVGFMVLDNELRFNDIHNYYTSGYTILEYTEEMDLKEILEKFKKQENV